MNYSVQAKPFNQLDRVVFKHASGDALKIHIIKPEAWAQSDRRPAIVFYYGGGWRNAYLTAFESHARYYASLGLVCFIAEYRVFNDHGTLPSDCVNDAQDAFAFVRNNAEKFGINPDKMVASGGSAGGHLAACLGTVKDARNGSASRPNAMVLFNPRCIVDPKNPQYAFVQELGTQAINISPYHQMDKDTPPSIIYHGTSDDLVPYEDSVLFHKKLLELGVRSSIELFENREHSFFLRK
jgi:acetyl esterase/lipase